MLREKIMSGKVLLQWRHTYCAQIAKERYMDPKSIRAMHTEIANIFFQQENDDADDSSSRSNTSQETDKQSGKINTNISKNKK